MLDLHEAMRGLRFAPEALAVLDANRQVRVISRQAERIFAVPAAELVGHTTNHLWSEDAQTTFALALNEAAERIGYADTVTPVIRRLKTDKTVVDMSVAAWHPTDDPVGFSFIL
jgi:PAS domain-containing protein